MSSEMSSGVLKPVTSQLIRDDTAVFGIPLKSCDFGSSAAVVTNVFGKKNFRQHFSHTQL